MYGKINKVVVMIASIAMIVIAAAMFAGCSGDGGNDPKAAEKNFVGSWEIISMESPEEGSMNNMLDTLRGMGADLNVIFEANENENNTVTINIATQSDDESLHGTWEAVDKNTVKLEVEGDSQEAKIQEDGTLVMEQEGVKMVCQKNQQ